MNLDIGGGTTNVVLFDGGEVRARGCLDIGGRQVTLDSRGRIAYISPSAGRIAQACHLNLVKGEPVSVETLNRLCDKMSEVLEQMLGVAEPTPLLEEVRTQGSALFKLPADRPVRFVCFSGGVADCIYQPGREPFAYGDIGVLLGKRGAARPPVSGIPGAGCVGDNPGYGDWCGKLRNYNFRQYDFLYGGAVSDEKRAGPEAYAE